MLMAGSSTPYYIYKDSSLMIIDSLTKDISLVSAEDCLIIPDVHGRDFWKDAANRFPGNIVFPQIGQRCLPAISTSVLQYT